MSDMQSLIDEFNSACIAKHREEVRVLREQLDGARAAVAAVRAEMQECADDPKGTHGMRCLLTKWAKRLGMGAPVPEKLLAFQDLKDGEFFTVEDSLGEYVKVGLSNTTTGNKFNAVCLKHTDEACVGDRVWFKPGWPVARVARDETRVAVRFGDLKVGDAFATCDRRWWTKRDELFGERDVRPGLGSCVVQMEPDTMVEVTP